MNSKKPIDIKLNVKPVFAWMIHEDAREGPCRWGSEEELSPEREREEGREHFEEFKNSIEENLTKKANLFDPTYLEFDEDLYISSSMLDELESDSENTDLYLISGVPGRQPPAIKIEERFEIPVAVVTAGVTNVDTAAYLRSRGREGYAPLDYQELNELIETLRVRKAIQKTKILVVSNEEILTAGVVSSVWDLEDLKKRFDIGSKRIPFQTFFEEMDRVERNEMEEVRDLTEELIERSDEVHMPEEMIERSLIAYLATKNLMEKYDCNAFTVPCMETCVSKEPAKRKFTPCLTHSLLKDEGYPSACEGDLSVLLAMMPLMYATEKTPYMGNPSIADVENPYIPQKSAGGEDDILRVRHDVPGIKMKGHRQPDLPFEIRPFTQGDWGATIRYDFTRDEGKKVTMARFNPNAEKLLVAEGEIDGGEGFDEIGCTLAAHIEVDDVRELLHKEADYGHHLAVVYGDHVEKLEKIAELMDFEIERA